MLLVFSVFVGVTLAFFANSDFASNLLGMSGKVIIEAVGQGDKSIEDNGACNLEIVLDRGYGVIIPNIPITIYANCKVKKSTTKPLLRARFQVTIFDQNENPVEEAEGNNVALDIFNELNDLALANSKWCLGTDGYFYYINTLNSSSVDSSILEEIDATSNDVVVNFLNGSVVRIPSYIDESYSGLSIKIKISFQAIQNFIPDDNGNKLPNTITNSLKIFNEFDDNLYESSPLNWFDITTSKDGTVSLVTKSGVNYPENLRLPEKTADGKTITNLSANLFKGNSTVKRVYIPSTYTSMDSSSFKESGLIMVDMSDTQITEIPDESFIRSNVTKILFPSGLTRIGKRAFNSCYLLNNVTFPSSLKTIDEYAFNYCKSLNLLGEIPASVTTIGVRAFTACPLIKISVSGDNSNFYDIDDKVLLSNDGRLLMYANQNTSTSLTIPDNVTTIDSMALYQSKYLTKLIFGKNLNNIQEIPDNIREIDVGTNSNYIREIDCYNNSYLIQKSNYSLIWGNIDDSATTLAYPDNVVGLNHVMVPSSNRKNITKITIGANAKTFNLNFGSHRNLETIEVNSSNKYFKTLTGKELVSLDGKTFYGIATALTGSYSIPNTINVIGYQAFSYSKFNSVVIPNSVQRIDHSCFGYMSNLSSISIPSSVTTMGSYVLQNCNVLKSISIANSTFEHNFAINCPKLESVTFGSGVTNISMNTLNNCTALKWIEFQSTTPPTFETGLIFQNTNSTFAIYVPNDSVNAYKTAKNLTAFASRVKSVSQKNT